MANLEEDRYFIIKNQLWIQHRLEMKSSVAIGGHMMIARQMAVSRQMAVGQKWGIPIGVKMPTFQLAIIQEVWIQCCFFVVAFYGITSGSKASNGQRFPCPASPKLSNLLDLVFFVVPG